MLAENLQTTEQVVEALPWLDMSRLRWWLRERERNGFAACVVRPSPGRILIDRAALDLWLESRRESAAG